MDHDIFSTPHTVTLELENRPNPDYSPWVPGEEEAPDTMAMWRVETTDGIGQSKGDRMFGLVSRDRGFLDSPDTEWISGGENSKRYKAVAIGRHGNFFHWGFSASPTHLTDSAKLVFLNAVHYIARFDGKAVLARKQDGVVLRDVLPLQIADLAKRHADAQGGNAAATTSVKGLDRYFTEAAWSALAQNPQQVLDALRENAPYFYPTGRYQLSVDEDLKALQIPNSASDFLTRAAALLRDDTTKAQGLRILTRYTDQSFTTTDAWLNWLQTHASHCFFSESAGYKWLVNRR